MAVSVATRYQTFLKQGAYASAWAMLAPEGKSDAAYALYQSEWAAVAKSSGPLDFSLGSVSHDWQSWDPNLPTQYHGNYGRAFIIVVDYPFTGSTNFWSVLLIMPTTDGATWEVCSLR
jgi:hypothetical protein